MSDNKKLILTKEQAKELWKKRGAIYICRDLVSFLVIICLFAINALQFYMIWFYQNGNTLEPRPYEGNTLPDELKTVYYYPVTKSEMKALVDTAIPTLYWVKENNDKVPDGSLGTAVWYIRLVYLLEEYSDPYVYGYVLAHELVHIKYSTGNETWVTYKTFTLLYESDSYILKEVAKYYALGILNMQYASDYSLNDYAYDVGAYIVEYFNK